MDGNLIKGDLADKLSSQLADYLNCTYCKKEMTKVDHEEENYEIYYDSSDQIIDEIDEDNNRAYGGFGVRANHIFCPEEEESDE